MIDRDDIPDAEPHVFLHQLADREARVPVDSGRLKKICAAERAEALKKKFGTRNSARVQRRAFRGHAQFGQDGRGKNLAAADSATGA